MADTNTSGQITTVDGLIQSGAVPSSEVAGLLETLRTQQDYNLVRSALQNYASGRNVNINALIGDSRRYLASQQEQQQTNQKTNASGFGEIATTLGAGALALTTPDTSGSDKIISAIDQAQRDALFGDQSPFTDVFDTGTITNKQLDLLSSDRLLDGQYQELEQRIRASDIGDAEKTRQLEALRDKHNHLVTERANQKNNAKKSWLQRRKEKQQEKDEQAQKDNLQKRLKTINERENNARKKGPLTKQQQEEFQQQRRQALKQYVMAHQGRNHDHMRDLLSERRFLRLGRRTSLGRPLRRALLGRIREDEKKQKEEARAKKKQPRDQSVEPVEETQQGVPLSPRVASELPPEEQQAPGIQPQQNTPRFPRIPGLRNAAGELAREAGLTLSENPVSLIVLLIGVLAILFIIIIVIILSSPATNPIPQLTRLNCGYYQYIVSLETTTQVGKSFNDQFGPLRFADQPNPTDPQAINAEKEFFNDVCALFGGVSIQQYPDPTKPYTFNTFGSLVDGTVDQRKNYKNFSVNLLQFEYFFRVNDGIPCSITFDGISGQFAKWVFHSPETCAQGQSGQPGQFDFLVAQNLAHSLIMQQNRLKGSTAVFTTFSNTPDAAGIMGQDGLLPTNDCQTSRNYQENANNQQQIDCFADMVGEYFTYPGYLDSIQPTKNPLLSISPVPTATTAAAIAATPFQDYPTKYPDYYTFANIHLFDTQEFFSSGDALGNSLLQRLNTFVGLIENCQGKNGKEFPPVLQCINNEKKQYATDTGALENISLNYQCGQFIWSIQKLFGWNFFKAGSGTGVSAWYFVNNTHKQDGYAWIDNPYLSSQPAAGANIQPGDIIIYTTTVPSSDTGHIAVVNKVETDHFHITLSESNFYEVKGLPIVSDYRKATLDEMLRDDGSVGKVVIRGWWRSTQNKQ